jgi:hypothetical protein
MPFLMNVLMHDAISESVREDGNSHTLKFCFLSLLVVMPPCRSWLSLLLVILTGNAEAGILLKTRKDRIAEGMDHNRGSEE